MYTGRFTATVLFFVTVFFLTTGFLVGFGVAFTVVFTAGLGVAAIASGVPRDKVAIIAAATSSRFMRCPI
jgi:hypothetical protein